MAAQHEKPFYSFPEVAALTGKSRVTIWKMARDTGHVYGVKVVHQRGNRFVVPRLPLERAIAGETAAPATTPDDVPVDWFDR